MTKPTIAGDYVVCLGVSESGAGSDVASVKTTAIKDGDDYVINLDTSLAMEKECFSSEEHRDCIAAFLGRGKQKAREGGSK